MKRSIIGLLVMSLAGCASINYGPLTVRTVGTDAQFEEASWAKVYPDKTVETFVLKGVKKNGSESTHTVANAALAIVGAIIGAPAGAPGAAAGAAIGGGGGEAVQRFFDWFNKPVSTNSPTTSTNATIATSSSLVDPNPAKYTQAYMDANQDSEECGIEAEKKIITRFCVIRGTSGGYWMLSSLGMDHVTRAQDGTGHYEDFTVNGYSYHIKGYTTVEPQQKEISTMPLGTSGKYAIAECRKQ